MNKKIASEISRVLVAVMVMVVGLHFSGGVSFADSTATITITAPNGGDDFTTNQSPQTVSGTCSSNAQALGTTLGTFADSNCSDGTWSLIPEDLSLGPNDFTITAFDEFFEPVSDTIIITYAPNLLDLEITAPNGGNSFATDVQLQTVSGTCSDNAINLQTTLGTFADDDCSDGDWELDEYTLGNGENAFIISAEDAQSNSVEDIMVITYITPLPTLNECGDVYPPESSPGAMDCGDGFLDVDDLYTVANFALFEEPDDCQAPRADMPTGTPPFCTAPDGTIDILDLMVITDKLMGRPNCCDFCDPDIMDSDSDGIADACDNCPCVTNPSQDNSDGDDVGDDCDNCPGADNQDQADMDGDCIGDACDAEPGTYDISQPDFDTDGIGDLCDNCPDDINPEQTDADADCLGDVCDNCSSNYNPEQEDNYPPGGNDCGDACECEGDVQGPSGEGDTDGDVDGSDAFVFKTHFGRNSGNTPCTSEDPCYRDFECDGDVDGTDAFKFKTDFGRSDCPACTFTCF